MTTDDIDGAAAQVEQRLRDIRERTAKATPGPWESKAGEREAAAFIAHSREDIPWLLDQLTASRAETANLRCELGAEIKFADRHVEMHRWMTKMVQDAQQALIEEREQTAKLRNLLERAIDWRNASRAGQGYEPVWADEARSLLTAEAPPEAPAGEGGEGQ